MAQRVTLVDDFDNSEGPDVQNVRVRVTRNGKVIGTWVGDLSDANYDSLVTKPLAKVRRTLSEVSGGADNAAASQNEVIRQWGRDNGYTVNAKGAISASLRSAYFDAHQDETDESTPETETSNA